jgi:hypothetical protein
MPDVMEKFYDDAKKLLVQNGWQRTQHGEYIVIIPFIKNDETISVTLLGGVVVDVTAPQKRRENVATFASSLVNLPQESAEP